MWPYNRDVSIALGVTTVISGIACYYMYNNESGGGSAAASVASVADVKVVNNNVELKTWNISRLFGFGKAIALSSAGTVANGNSDLSSP
jgi:hypothetical protein